MKKYFLKNLNYNIMNFKYCLWLIPIKDHIWNTYTNGFNPHITIKSHLNFNEAVSLYNSIKKEPIDNCIRPEI